MKSTLLLFISCVLIFSNTQAAEKQLPINEYNIGVFYYPGWKDNAPGSTARHPWSKIKSYPDREPLLGWYKDGDEQVIQQQLRWMKEYEIDFVVFDWYWSVNNKTFLDHTVSSYLRVNDEKKIKFALLWANHNQVPQNLEQFNTMVTFWVKEYFGKKEYMTIGGKPVIFIFSMMRLREKMKEIGISDEQIFSSAQMIAVKYGYPGIYFVGGTPALSYWTRDHGVKAKYDAYSAYNYHVGYSGKFEKNKRYSNSFTELMEAYEENWSWLVNNSPLPYFLPMTSGWDKRPWGGSKQPSHDLSMSTPELFELHLKQAKEIMDTNSEKTMKTGVICCWNEYGEGSYIEPTIKYRFEYLEKVKEVFGK